MTIRTQILVAALAVATAAATTAAAGSQRTAEAHLTPAPHVLLVGSWHGKAGEFGSIEAAVEAARPGDWILIGPGDYHERPGSRDGVRITTANLHLRGMSRGASSTGPSVVIDGTLPGAPVPCDPQGRWQNLGPDRKGRNGIVVEGADHVSIENLTVCNFVGGRQGRQITFEGGYGSGTSGLGAFEGSYLTVTSSFASRRAPALDGIFVSNTHGPGEITRSFASNMADSAFHIGACANCNTVFDRDTAEHSVIALTAIDAGGHLTIERSTFRGNTAGIDLASEEDESSPPPQDGACPRGDRGPIAAHAHSCTVVEGNLVDGNNDPNVPGGQGGVLRLIGAGHPDRRRAQRHDHPQHRPPPRRLRHRPHPLPLARAPRQPQRPLPGRANVQCPPRTALLLQRLRQPRRRQPPQQQRLVRELHQRRPRRRRHQRRPRQLLREKRVAKRRPHDVPAAVTADGSRVPIQRPRRRVLRPARRPDRLRHPSLRPLHRRNRKRHARHARGARRDPPRPHRRTLQPEPRPHERPLPDPHRSHRTHAARAAHHARPLRRRTGQPVVPLELKTAPVPTFERSPSHTFARWHTGRAHLRCLHNPNRKRQRHESYNSLPHASTLARRGRNGRRTHCRRRRHRLGEHDAGATAPPARTNRTVPGRNNRKGTSRPAPRPGADGADLVPDNGDTGTRRLLLPPPRRRCSPPGHSTSQHR